MRGEIIKIFRDERALEDFTFYANVANTESEKKDFLQNFALEHSRQIIIFGCLEELVKIENWFHDFSACLLTTKFTKIHQKVVLNDFKSEVLKILLCESKSALMRKIEAKEAVDVINLDIPIKLDIFMMRVRRFSPNPLDTIWILFEDATINKLQNLVENLCLKIDYVNAKN